MRVEVVHKTSWDACHISWMTDILQWRPSCHASQLSPRQCLTIAGRPWCFIQAYLKLSSIRCRLRDRKVCYSFLLVQAQDSCKALSEHGHLAAYVSHCPCCPNMLARTNNFLQPSCNGSAHTKGTLTPYWVCSHKLHIQPRSSPSPS